jgi:hypothetical protein
MRIALMLLVAGLSFQVMANPCDGINRNLDDARKSGLRPVVGRQLKVTAVDVLESFRQGSWDILYVDTHASDEVFLFYKGDPLNSSPVAMWSGAAAKQEENDISAWAAKNASGIPQALAACFAWYVTEGGRAR